MSTEYSHSCKTCGALLYDRDIHRMWHAGRNEPFDAVRVIMTTAPTVATAAGQTVQSLLPGLSITIGSSLADVAPAGVSIPPISVRLAQVADD